MIKSKIQSVFNKLGYKIIKKPLENKLKIENSKFDFVIFSSGRVGSKALQYFLNQHPQIYIISRKEIDFSMKEGPKGIKNLVDRFSITINKLKLFNIKSGIVIHNAIDALKPEIITALSKISEKSIYIVRNPIDLAKSLNRHMLYDLTDTPAYKLYEFGYRESPLSIDHFSKELIMKYKKRLCKSYSSLTYFRHAKNIKKSFLNFKTFKYEEVYTSLGFKNLIKFIECDTNYKIDYNEKVNASINRYLRYNKFKMTLPTGPILQCRLETSLNTIYNTDDGHWITLPVKFKNIHEIFNCDNFYLSIYKNDYLILSRNEILILYKYSDYLFKDLIEEVITKLLKGISNVESIINLLINQGIANDIEKKKLTLYEEDFKLFYKNYF